MINVADLASDARDEAVPVIVNFDVTAGTALRVYPPPNVDWRLTGVRWELMTPIGVSETDTIDVKDAAGTALVTQISMAGAMSPGDAGSRGLRVPLATLTGDQLEARSSEGNAYHTVTPGAAIGAATIYALVTLYYRKVMRSGSDSSARIG